MIGLAVDADSISARAKRALEHVCSGAHRELAAEYYSPEFVDHVNDLEFRGLGGVEQSIGLYRKLLVDVTISVEEQLCAGQRVTSRFVVSGASLGRRVSFNGITISRFEHNLIVEDWSVVDTLGMLRQLGPLRSVLVAIRALGALTAASPKTSPMQAFIAARFARRARRVDSHARDAAGS